MLLDVWMPWLIAVTKKRGYEEVKKRKRGLRLPKHGFTLPKLR